MENARETVLPDGTIQGILEKNAAAGRVDGIFGKLGSAGGEMEKVSGKTLGKVDTAIDFPAGTDLILTLDQPLAANSIFAADGASANLTSSGGVCAKSAFRRTAARPKQNEKARGPAQLDRRRKFGSGSQRLQTGRLERSQEIRGEVGSGNGPGYGQ